MSPASKSHSSPSTLPASSRKASKSTTQRATATSTSTAEFLPFKTTGELLISKNTRLITLLNSRDYTSPFYASCLSPDLHLEQHGVICKGIDGFIEAYKSGADENPAMHVHVLNTSAIVDEPAGGGHVLLHVNAMGFRDGIQKAATALSRWRRKDDEGGRWECYAYFMFFGIQEFA